MGIGMILAKEFEGELWIKAAHHDQAVKQAVEAEREECAKVCDELADDAYNNEDLIYEQAAKTIRARGQG